MGIREIKQKTMPFVDKYGLKSVSVFGSYATETQNEDSDVDFLVEFLNTPSIFKVMGLREELKRALNKDVDIVTLPLARPDLLNIGKSERIYG
ncbi:MAG: nucleotidyltransferase domain-containing protein [Acidobacteriota bacterium]|jgi:predicted nucleotidyltransferase|nr:nucleotidyltransferase domain-containing protein [Acidobacteriota bacterium]